MTALCGGGDSRVKPGLAEIIVLGSGVVASLLNNRGRFWAAVVAPLVGVISYDALNLCQNDPPAEPTITADDALAILNINDLDAFAAAIAKFRDLIIRAAWFEFCECVAPPQPDLAPLPQPPGWPDLGRLYQPGPSVPCLHLTAEGEPATTHTNQNQGTAWEPFDTLIDTTWTVHAIPTGATQVRFRYTTELNGANHGQTRFVWQAFTLHHTANRNPGGFHDGFAPLTFDTGLVPIDADAAIMVVKSFRQNSSVPTDDLMAIQVDYFCGGGGGLSPCGPDPMTLGLLQQLVQLTTLIQRQAVPFAYIHGTAHNDLVGDGEIAVQGLIGMLVDITAVPAGAVGTTAGNPDVLFGAGWFNWGNADGFTGREHLSALSQLSLPAAAGQFTRFAYSLPPGLEVRLTELVREA